eukprot:1161240-Pelagomonas_calceolata.AAC.3
MQGLLFKGGLGMYWEARGDFNQAEAAYKAILLEQPNNEMALKRQGVLTAHCFSVFFVNGLRASI